MKKGEYTSFKFIVKESPTVDLEYNVFIFFVNYSKSEQNELIKKFNDEKQKTNLKKIQKQSFKRTYDENDFMTFETLHEFSSKKQWDRIYKNILSNPEFYACVQTLNRKTFSIK